MDKEELQEIARQLACPDGVGGLSMAEKMNKTNVFITARSIEALAPAEGEWITEIGPGNGLLSEPIVRALGKQGLFFGVDQSKTMAEAAMKHLSRPGQARVDFFNGDCLGAPIRAGSMDAVMAVNVLYFIDDLNSFFETIAGWLKPGARAVFGVRSPETIARMPFTQYGFNARCSDEIEALMRASGFNHVDIACYDEGLVSLGDIEIAMDSMIIRGQI